MNAAGAAAPGRLFSKHGPGGEVSRKRERDRRQAAGSLNGHIGDGHLLFGTARRRFLGCHRSLDNSGVQFGPGFGHQIAQRLRSFGSMAGNAAGCIAGGPCDRDTHFDAALGHGAADIVHGITQLGIAQATHHRSQCHEPGAHAEGQNSLEFKHR